MNQLLKLNKRLRKMSYSFTFFFKYFLQALYNSQYLFKLKKNIHLIISMEKNKDEYIIRIRSNITPNSNKINSKNKYKIINDPNKNNIPFINQYENIPLETNISKQYDTVSSEAFYSVQSEIILLDVKEDKSDNLKNKVNQEIKTDIQNITKRPKIIKDKDTIDYGLEKEYKEMEEFINERQYEKIRELDKKILHQEILKRKEENKVRLENLEKIEQKLSKENNRMAMSESQFKFKNGNNPELINSLYIPNVLNTNKKVDLVLANVEKGGGYRVIPLNELNENYDAVPFGGYVFYQKKRE
jgi:hypothetical protein